MRQVSLVSRVSSLPAGVTSRSLNVLCVDGGQVRIEVPYGAHVEYCVLYAKPISRYALEVSIDGKRVGWHCGDRTGEAVCFMCERDARRLRNVRNAAWAASMSKREVA